MEPVRVGVLGPGRIVSRVMKDFHAAKNVVLTAVASRSLERAQEAARKYGAKYAFGSYEELAACGEVDLVYISTPHAFHCEQALLMMRHGKHVLCEKPMALTSEQTMRMIQCAREHNVFLMEAMWTRCFPATKRLAELIGAGEIGRVRHIYSIFSSVAKPDPEGRLFHPALGGGALMDIGVYPLMATTLLLGCEPEEMQVAGTLTETGVDERMAIQLRYADGATAQLMTALDAAAPSLLMIYGTGGSIEVRDFWHPSAFTVRRTNGEEAQYRFPQENEGFRLEFDHVAECIREGRCESPLMTWAETLAVSRITEQLRHRMGVYYPCEEPTKA